MSRSVMNILPKSIKDYISSNRVYLFLRTRKALRKFFPVTTYFEITSYCNLKCKGCYRTLHNYPAKNKHMSFQDFKTYLDQLPHTRRLTLNGLGEPALNPDMLKMVKYARGTGKVDVIDFTTNALACEPEFYDKLFSHGLSMMDISVDSLDQNEVKGLRPPTNVKLLAKNVKYLVNKYPDKTLCRVVVSKKNIDTFQNTIYNLIKMGTKTISCVPFDDFGNSELPLSPKEKTTFLKKYNQLKKKYPHIYLDASNWFEPVTSPCCNPYN
ncbi:MAG: radical SAM protein, partial [Petrotogales bacterium]